METSLRILFFCVNTPIIFCSLILFLSIANRPEITVAYPLKTTEIKQLKAIFRPIFINSKDIKTLQLTQKNLNNLLNYFLKRYFEIATHITVVTDELQFKITLGLPNNAFGDYLNFGFSLKHHDNHLFTLHSLQIGRLVIADEISHWLLTRLSKDSRFNHLYKTAKKTLKIVEITPKYLILTYQFKSPFDHRQLMSSLTTNQQALNFYQQKIINIIHAHDPAWRLSLAQLLQPLFKIAYQRSTFKTAINENKTVILAVSHYVNQSEIQHYLSFDTADDHQRQYATFLYQRRDMAKHFMTSALLTAVGNRSLAVILGQEKELSDAKWGSGFSFIDLAGDRAGIRFGKMATDSQKSARRLQKFMAKIKNYRAFMPEVRDLPENMSDKVFKDKFGSIDSPAYQMMLKKIDNRIIALPIYSDQLKTGRQ